MQPPDDLARSRILTATGVLLALTVVHDLDHVRQGRHLDSELYGIGLLSLIAALVVLGLALRRSPLGGPAAVILGIGTIAGVAAIHVAPTWWPLSDSYGDAGVDAISWTVVTVMMLAGAGLAWAGLSSSSKDAVRPT